MEEIGIRATVFMLDGVKGEQEAYITWLLEQCTQEDQALDELITDEALMLLVERLATPLQIEYYLSRAFEEGYRAGQKPITPEVINMALVNDLDDLEPRFGLGHMKVYTFGKHDLPTFLALIDN
jgi:type II secretory pathway predicted ATPase ExeA